MFKKTLWLLLCGLMLFACEAPKDEIGENSNFDYQPESQAMEEEYSSFSMKASYKNEVIINNQINMTDFSIPLEIEFESIGKDREVNLSLFYDFMQIPFKITQEGEYATSHKFNISNGESQKITVYLSDEILKVDEDIHKLLISFVAGSDVNASSIEGIPSNHYGIHKVLDIIYDNSSTDKKMFNNNLKFEKALNYYQFNSLEVILNMDYENEFQKDNIIAAPEKEYTVQSGDEFELMYNISNIGDYNNALLLTTIGFEQTTINETNLFQLIELNEHETANGKISLLAPDKPGKYDIIAYVVYNPLEKLTKDSHDNSIVYTSPRFTLNVIE